MRWCLLIVLYVYVLLFHGDCVVYCGKQRCLKRTFRVCTCIDPSILVLMPCHDLAHAGHRDAQQQVIGQLRQA